MSPQRIVLLALAVALLIASNAYAEGMPSDVLFYEFGSSGCPHCLPLHEFLSKHFPNQHYFCDVATNESCAYRFATWLEMTGLPPYVPQTIVVKNDRVLAVVIGEVRDVDFWLHVGTLKPNLSIPIYVGTKLVGYLRVKSWDAHRTLVSIVLGTVGKAEQTTMQRTTITPTTTRTVAISTRSQIHTTTKTIGYTVTTARTTAPTTSTSTATITNTTTTQNALKKYIELQRRRWERETLPYLLVVLALTDSVNPCVITIYTLLLAGVLMVRGRSGALLSGISFILGIITGYLALGVGLVTGLSAIHIPRSVLRGVLIAYGAAVIVLAVTRWRGGAECTVCREDAGGLSCRLVKVGEVVTKSRFGHYLLGLLLSVTLLPCSAGPYLAFALVLSRLGSIVAALGYLLVYNVIFVAPLLAVTLCMVLFSKKIDAAVKKYEVPIRIAAGMLLIVVAGIM